MAFRGTRGPLLWIGAIGFTSTMLSAQSLQFEDLHRMVPLLRGTARVATTGDLDGDGNTDLVLLGGDRNTTWRAAGNGRFATLQHAPGLPRLPRGAVVADLDGDGDNDIAVANTSICDTFGSVCNGGLDLVLWNDGSGRLDGNGPTLPADPAVISQSVDAGDVDGDGDIDLVFGCAPHVWGIFMFPLPTIWSRVHGENWLFLNNGNGSFTAANARLGTARDATAAVLLRDFDGDGDLDLFVANAAALDGASSAQDVLYRNDGLGNFAIDPNSIPVETDNAEAAHAVDIDGDGDLDLAVRTATAVRLLRNNGSALFTDISAGVPTVQPGVGAVFFGDFDGDGDLDLGEQYGTQVLQLRNNGLGAFTHAPAFDRSIPASLVVALDADADGDTDLVLPAGDYVDSSMMLNDGTGRWLTMPRDLPPSIANQLNFAIADFDLDGDADVAAPAASSPGMFYRNDGSGRFAAVGYGDFTVDADETMGVAVGDLDNDAFPDLVLANTGFGPPGISRLYRNDNAGRLDRVAIPAVDAWSVAVGDLDRDGDLDIYFGTQTTDVVMRNDGNLSFTVIPGAVAENAPTNSVALVDIDGDLDLDAIVVGWYGQSCRVLRNDGTGVFTVVPGAVPTLQDNSQFVVAGDFDGDGDQDFVIANDGGGLPEANRFFRNDGTGTFTASSQDLPQDLGRTISYTAADVDADGDLDLFECSFFGDVPSRLLANDGLGHFAVVPNGLPPVTDLAHQFGVADFDLDGDLDAFLVAQASPNVFWNLHRQLAWRELPRIGRPLTMDLFGGPAEPFALGVATQRHPFPIFVPGIGSLLADLGTLVQLDFGVLDAQGRGGLTYAVPNLPGLLQVPFFWQAVVGNPLVVTNLEHTELQAP